jgi:heavy metal translocating P-type ATPase
MPKNLWNNFYSSLSESKWQALLSLACLAAMLLHFFLKIFSTPLSNIPLFIIIVVGGLPLLTQIAIRALNKNLGADLLAFIALIVAVYLGEYLAAVLIVLMLASGQALEEYATRKASFVLEALAKRMPSIVHLKRENKVEDVETSTIKIGDLLEVYPHETCPADGVIVEGSGTMDEAYLTGEPYKISKTLGSQVLSGAINGDSLLVIRVEKLPQDSRYAKIVEVMQDAQQQKPNLRRLADRIGAIFAPVALALAFATLIFSGSLTKFLAVLVVATPCPLLIAIPITIISAISIAARHGIIIKDPTVLERLPTCAVAIFDKTGTLTYGQPELVDTILLQKFSRQEVLQMAASLEKYSRHPLAGAILDAAKKENIHLLEAQNVSEKPGQGLTGKIAGHEIFVTSRKKIAANHPNLPILEHGLECVIMIDQNPAALLNFRDTPRAESHLFINHLIPNHSFKKIVLLSGDRGSEVNYLASLLGIKDSFAGQSPEQKLEFVRSETAKAPTLFMGDGINDAPALMAATVGIAFGQNSAVTSESAGAVILESSLAKVDELIHISDSMRKIALQSAIGGMLLSLVGIGFAMAGIISPVMGAVLQEIIDVAAILNALRLTWQSEIASDIK